MEELCAARAVLLWRAVLSACATAAVILDVQRCALWRLYLCVPVAARIEIAGPTVIFGGGLRGRAVKKYRTERSLLVLAWLVC